jgi:hypothetical protein
MQAKMKGQLKAGESEDQWINLSMRGVSDLSGPASRTPFIFDDDG